MAAPKIFTVNVNRRGNDRFVSGTLAQLIQYYSYTLECGNSWNRKISREPKTIKSFEKNYNMSVDETQGGYDRSYMSIVNPGEPGFGTNPQS